MGDRSNTEIKMRSKRTPKHMKPFFSGGDSDSVSCAESRESVSIPVDDK